MKAKINRKLLNTTTFDSGSLGVLAMVLHPFTSSGRYDVAITKNGRIVRNSSFVVHKESKKSQLDIDLSSSKLNSDDNLHDVSPKGYVLFHVSSGSGYSVSVKNENGDNSFNSKELTKGDLFALSLLKPGEYSIVNKLDSGKGGVEVSFTDSDAKNIKDLETSYVEVTKNKLTPNNVKLVSSQGLVFKVSDSSRILIEKGAETRSESRLKPVIRWKKPLKP